MSYSIASLVQNKVTCDGYQRITLAECLDALEAANLGQFPVDESRVASILDSVIAQGQLWQAPQLTYVGVLNAYRTDSGRHRLEALHLLVTYYGVRTDTNAIVPLPPSDYSEYTGLYLQLGDILAKSAEFRKSGNAYAPTVDQLSYAFVPGTGRQELIDSFGLDSAKATYKAVVKAINTYDDTNVVEVAPIEPELYVLVKSVETHEAYASLVEAANGSRSVSEIESKFILAEAGLASAGDLLKLKLTGYVYEALQGVVPCSKITASHLAAKFTGAMTAAKCKFATDDVWKRVVSDYAAFLKATPSIVPADFARNYKVTTDAYFGSEADAAVYDEDGEEQVVTVADWMRSLAVKPEPVAKAKKSSKKDEEAAELRKLIEAMSATLKANNLSVPSV